MALGIQTTSGGGDFLGVVKFDARAGRFFRVDRSQDSAGAWQSDDVEVPVGSTFVMDLANIEVGWISFTSGRPDFHLVPLGQPLPAKPSADHKQGLRVRLFAPTLLGGVREFSHTAKCVLASVDALHDAFSAAPEARAGKVPVVKFAGTTAVKTTGPQGTTTNYAPQLAIEKWIDRPADLPSSVAPGFIATAAAAAPAAAPAAAKPAAQHVPPPAQPAPAPVSTVGAPDF